jgi:hypothetical protein
MLEMGTITLSTKSPETGFVIALHTKPSLLLDLPTVVRNEPHGLTAVAHRGAQLSFIGREELMGLIELDHITSMNILRMLATGLNMARKAIVRPPLVEHKPLGEYSGQFCEHSISDSHLSDSKPRRMLDW